MHAYFIARGQISQVEDWIAAMRGTYWPWPRVPLEDVKDKDGNIIEKKGEVQQHYVQTGLRPIQLFEVCIPEEQMPVLLETLDIPPGNKKQPHDNYFKWIFKGFRKALKLDPVPNYKPTGQKRLIPHPGVSIVCLGVKKDEENRTFGYKQEGL